MPSNPTKTVRQRIIKEIKDRLTAMVETDNSKIWENIFSGQIMSADPLKVPMVSIEEGPEDTIENMFPTEMKQLTLFAQFRFERRIDVESFDTFNYYLGKLQARLFGTADNKTLGGLSINVEEVGSNPEIESQSDPSPGGLLTFKVTYKIVQGDPYHLPSEIQSYG